MSLNEFKKEVFLALRRFFVRDPNTFAPHGIPISLPPGVDSPLNYLLARKRPYEAAEAELINLYLKPGTDVVELGGCLGVISALIRERIGTDAKHIVVEANTRLKSVLENNATRGNSNANTEFVYGAVDYSGADTVSFSVTLNSHGGHVGGSDGTLVSVPTLKLSALSNKVQSPFALICDIEGAEVGMIDSDLAVLDAVSLFVLEIHPDNYEAGDDTTKDMIAKIETTGLSLVKSEANVLCFLRDTA